MVETNDSEFNKDVFINEAAEQLSILEETLLELEHNPHDKDLLDTAFRALHTIKGSGGLFGFDDIVNFTHDIENVYDQIRSGKLEIDSQVIDLTLSSHDCLKNMLDPGNSNSEEEQEKRARITASFRNVLGLPTVSEEAITPPKEEPPKSEPVGNGVRKIINIRFKPNENIFAFGTNPVLLLRELTTLGECHIIARADRIPGLEALDPEKSYVWWDIILVTFESRETIKDVFMFVEDDAELIINEIGSEEEIDEDLPFQKLGQILVRRGDLNEDELKEFLSKKERLGKTLVDSGLVLPDQVQSALMEQDQLKLNTLWKRSEAITNIRHVSRQVNRLRNILTLLAEQHHQIAQYASENRDLPLEALNEKSEKITNEVQSILEHVDSKIQYQKFLTF